MRRNGILVGKKYTTYRNEQVMSQFGKPLYLLVPDKEYVQHNSGDTEMTMNYMRYNELGQVIMYTGKDKVPVYLYWYQIGKPMLITKDKEFYDKYLNLIHDINVNSERNYEKQLKNDIQQSKALSNIYLYDPLYGLRYKIDYNGKITYYSYDAAGRLSSISENGKVKLTFNYNYLNK